MVAIQTRQNICVQAVPGGMQLLQGNCAGAAWIGLDSNGAGVISLQMDAMLHGTEAQALLRALGALGEAHRG